MKKFICYILACALIVLALAACGEGDGGTKEKAGFTLDGKTFTFAYAQEGTKVVACASADASLHKDAKAVDYTLSAAGGKLTFAGADGTSEGEYVVYKTSDTYSVYKISVGGDSGYASLTVKELEGGAKEYSLLITLTEHTVQFVSK